jgi:hypothetical protein
MFGRGVEAGQQVDTVFGVHYFWAELNAGDSVFFSHDLGRPTAGDLHRWNANLDSHDAPRRAIANKI